MRRRSKMGLHGCSLYGGLRASRLSRPRHQFLPCITVGMYNR